MTLPATTVRCRAFADQGSSEHAWTGVRDGLKTLLLGWFAALVGSAGEREQRPLDSALTTDLPLYQLVLLLRKR